VFLVVDTRLMVNFPSGGLVLSGSFRFLGAFFPLPVLTLFQQPGSLSVSSCSTLDAYFLHAGVVFVQDCPNAPGLDPSAPPSTRFLCCLLCFDVDITIIYFILFKHIVYCYLIM